MMKRSSVNDERERERDGLIGAQDAFTKLR